MKVLLSLVLLTCLLVLPAVAQPVVTPANLTVNAGASFAFTASSTNAVSFQWVFNGTNINNATNAEYYADNPATNQAGAYWVVTGNLDGTVTSNAATLTVLQGTVVNFRISTFGNGAASNVLVELFDHDKPATVENFVHYIRTIGYSNVFFDRLIPGFVLQGGDYDAYDRTNTTPGAINTNNIFTSVVENFQVANPSIPFQIDSEFFVGPQVSNVKGTLALALPSGNVNGGNSAFFFNLVDNSGAPSYLDEQEFTVFGRVIGGQNVLDYFNNTNNFSKLSETNFPTNLVFSSNPFTNGIFDWVYVNTNDTFYSDLPVNFYGTNIPADINLFFVDFSFPDAQPFIDTTPPTVAITYPPANLLVTNGYDMVVRGTAYDNVGLALVNCYLDPQNGANGYIPLGTYANGTTNWSEDFGVLSPGIYSVNVLAEDGTGNENPLLTLPNLIVTAILTNGVGTVTLTNLSTGAFSTNAVGAYMEINSDYSLDALPGTNQLFVNWSNNVGYPNTFTPLIGIEMSQYLVLTANFISNGLPGSLAFTYPPLNGIAGATNGVFAIEGTISGSAIAPVSITCQLYSTSNGLAYYSAPLQTTGTNNWTVSVTNLPDGPYLAQVIAQDAAGRQTLISNAFTVQTLDPLTVVVNGPGSVTTNLNGAYLQPGQTYSMTATATAGGLFENWSDNNGNINLSPVESFTMSSNLVLTANFISNSIPGSVAFTYPIPGKTAYATNGVLGIQGTISGPAAAPVTISCQLFSAPGQVALGTPLVTVGTSTWSVQTNLPNGQYYAQVVAQDAQGRTTFITNGFSVETVNQLTVVVNGPGTVTTNLGGQYLLPGTNYSMKAAAMAGGLFENWSDNNGNINLSPVESFTMSSNLVLTANFISNSIPGSVAFTYPIPGKTAYATNGVLDIQGTISGQAAAPVAISCQVFFANGELATATPLVTSGTSTWGVQTNLPNGQYYAQVVAQDAQGRTTFITNAFNVVAVNLMTVAVNGPGTVITNFNGQYLVPGTNYSMKATPDKNAAFVTWSDGTNSTLSAKESFAMSSNLVLTATFVSNDIPGAIAFTYPKANAKVTNSALTLTGTAKTSIRATQIVCQLFSASNSLGVPVVASLNSGGWTVPAGSLVSGQTNIAPGNYTAVATVYNSAGESTLISENFSVLAHLTVATSSNLVVPPIYNASGTNTNMVVVSPQLLGTVSLANSNGGYLTAGTPYTITAKPKTGYLFAYWVLNGVTNTSSTYSFSLTSDQTIIANFATNYFPKVAGTYDGLFIPPYTNAAPTNSGYFTMTVSSTGVASIKLSFPGKSVSYNLTGMLPYFCSVDAELPGLDGNELILEFGIDVTNLAGSLTGYVYDYNGSWYGGLTAYKVATGLTAHSAVPPGRYTMTLPGFHTTNASEPGGDGVATYSISAAGAVAVSGSLADATAFTQSTGVSSNGIWPLYVPLYPGAGSVHEGVLIGWQTNGQATSFLGLSQWLKPAVAAKAGTYYDSGFDVELPTQTAAYVEPVAGKHYQITFSGATLSGTQTNTLTVSSAHLFTADAGQSNLKVTLTPATGAITGQFMTTNNVIKKITGVFLNPTSGGSGYFLDTNGQSGYFELQLQQ
jgi:cyclophilin family peptidyl-prolyl cis-trans isomerase